MMRYYDFSTPRRTRLVRKKNNTWIKRVILLALFLLLIPFFYSKSVTLFQNNATKQVLSTKVTQTSDQIIEKQQTTALGLVIQSELKNAKGKYSIVVKHLKTGETYASNEHVQFKAGSLYKLWVMGEAMRQIETKKLSVDLVLTKDIKDLNNIYHISSDAAELHDGSITVTVNQAIKQMITISHNYAALLLANQLTLPKIGTFLREYNLNESTIIDPPSTTASDISLFFELLYRGKLANTENTQQMIDLLKQQRLNDKMPKYLPTEVVVAHKTGELDMVSHDAGIVYTPFGDYIFVVLTQTQYPPDAEEEIAKLSKVVYQYFMKN